MGQRGEWGRQAQAGWLGLSLISSQICLFPPTYYHKFFYQKNRGRAWGRVDYLYDLYNKGSILDVESGSSMGYDFGKMQYQGSDLSTKLYSREFRAMALETWG